MFFEFEDCFWMKENLFGQIIGKKKGGFVAPKNMRTGCQRPVWTPSLGALACSLGQLFFVSETIFRVLDFICLLRCEM